MQNSHQSMNGLCHIWAYIEILMFNPFPPHTHKKIWFCLINLIFVYLLQVGLLRLAELYLQDEFKLDSKQNKPNSILTKLERLAKSMSEQGTFLISVHFLTYIKDVLQKILSMIIKITIQPSCPGYQGSVLSPWISGFSFITLDGYSYLENTQKDEETCILCELNRSLILISKLESIYKIINHTGVIQSIYHEIFIHGFQSLQLQICFSLPQIIKQTVKKIFTAITA